MRAVGATRANGGFAIDGEAAISDDLSFFFTFDPFRASKKGAIYSAIERPGSASEVRNQSGAL